jgi:hypothetical protein
MVDSAVDGRVRFESRVPAIAGAWFAIATVPVYGMRIESHVVSINDTIVVDSLGQSRQYDGVLETNQQGIELFKCFQDIQSAKLRGESQAAAPSYTAKVKSERIVTELAESGFLPRRIAASVVGGIGFTYYGNSEAEVYVEVYNDGSAYSIATMSDGRSIVEPISDDGLGLSTLKLLVREACQ